MQPGTVAIQAWRNGRYAEEYDFTDEDGTPVNLSGYSAAMQVRLYGAAPGAALISLPNVTGDMQGARVIDPVGGAVALRIDEQTLAATYAALSPGLEPGTVIRLKYDLVLSAAGTGDEVWLQGDFMINPGVTV